MTSAKAQFCTFVVDGQFFGIEVDRVQEIIRYQEMTKVPLSSRTIGGLLSLRGQIVIAIDLRQRLGFDPRPPDQRPMNVLVRSDGGIESLLVDEIGEVVEVEPSAFESPPCTLKGVARELVRGVYKLEGRLLLLLDVNQVVHLDLQSQRGLETAGNRKD